MSLHNLTLAHVLMTCQALLQATMWASCSLLMSGCASLWVEACGMCSHLKATPSQHSATRGPARPLLGRAHLAGPPSLAPAPQGKMLQPARLLPLIRPRMALQLLVRQQHQASLQQLGSLARTGRPHLGRPQRPGSPTATGRQPQGRALRQGRPARMGQPLPARTPQLGRPARTAQRRLR